MVNVLVRLENGYTVRKFKRLSAKRITKTLKAWYPKLVAWEYLG